MTPTERSVWRHVALGAFLAILIIGALFFISGCGRGVPSSYGPAAPTAAVPEPRPLADYVGPGVLRIGPDIAPGVWVTPGATTALCSYWLREDDQDGPVVEAGSAGPGERLLVQLPRTGDADVFESSGCEPWREVTP